MSSQFSEIFHPGDLVEIHSWRKREEEPRVGVVVMPVCEAAVDDFSRYAVLVDKKVVTIRRDRMQRFKKKDQ